MLEYRFSDHFSAKSYLKNIRLINNRIHPKDIRQKRLQHHIISALFLYPTTVSRSERHENRHEKNTTNPMFRTFCLVCGRKQDDSPEYLPQNRHSGQNVGSVAERVVHNTQVTEKLHVRFKT